LLSGGVILPYWASKSWDRIYTS